MNIAFAPTAQSSVTLTPVRDGLWRVAGTQGTIMGHVERVTDTRGERYEARRLRRSGSNAALASIGLGAFWRLEDAVDCFRFN